MNKLIVMTFVLTTFLISCGKDKTEWVDTNADEFFGGCSEEKIGNFSSSSSPIQPRDYCTSMHDGFAGEVQCKDNIIQVQCNISESGKVGEKIELYLGTRYTTPKSSLKMRDSGDLKGKEIAEIPANSEVKILEQGGKIITISGTEGRWTRVKFQNKIGWVFGGFLSKTKSDQVSESTQDPKNGKPDSDSENNSNQYIGTRYVNAKVGLRMRTSPTTDSKVVTTLPYNSKVNLISITDKEETISGKEAKWKKIEYKGKVGYVFGGFLSESKDGGSQDTEKKKQPVSNNDNSIDNEPSNIDMEEGGDEEITN